MDVLIKIVQFFLSLTLLVTVHELGHFIVAKLCRVRVDKFYVFFDFGFAFLRKKIGETEYGIGWCPLGGYCKMSGMVDESMDLAFKESEPKPYEFRSKRPWQRFLILAAGVSMNILAAFVIYSGITYSSGTVYLDNQQNVYGYDYGVEARSMGFENGDRILRIDGRNTETPSDIFSGILLASDDIRVDIERRDSLLTLDIPSSRINIARQSRNLDDFLILRMPFEIDSVASATAVAAGLRKGDVITGVGDVREDNFFKYAPILAGYSGKNAPVSVLRGETPLVLDIPVDENGKIGVFPCQKLPYCVKQYSFAESIPQGAATTWKVVESYWDQLCLMARPSTGMYKQVGGFIAIGNIFPGSWDWLRFWEMTAFISIVLAIMNLIPIPGLDGGHILFTLWEMITGRKVSDRVLIAAQYVGLMFLLFLLFYANGSDIYRLFND